MSRSGREGAQFEVPAFWRGLALAAFLIYVLANSKAFYGQLPALTKHGAFIALALLGLFARTRQVLAMCTIAAPIVAIYFIGGVPVYGVMVLVFAASLPVVSAVVVDAVTKRRRSDFVLLAMVALLPAMIAGPDLASDGIFDETYGRERVLLGYWHPKEASICFGIPVLMVIMSLRRHAVPLAVLACVGIAFVGSRNVALLLIFGTLLRFYPKCTAAAACATVGAVLAYLSLNPELLEALDTLMSLRLTMWTEALSDPAAAAGLNVLDGERFAVDSFFIEAYIYAGAVALLLVGSWLLAALAASRRSGPLGAWSWVAVVLLLMFAALDSGIASTGNLMHALLWSIIFSPMLRSRRRTARAATASRQITPLLSSP